MAKKHPRRRPHARTRRRRRVTPRRHYFRRRSDFYVALAKFSGLIGTVCIAILGQAELIGEPWRHYITVVSIISIAVWGYGMHPQTLSALGKAYKLMRTGKMVF